MAVFNLMHKDFRTAISCNKPSVDGYEVDNLLTSNAESLSYFTLPNGFLAETFIKPPVDIIIKFPFNVDIEKVLVDSKLGGQSSCGFELFGYTSKIEKNYQHSEVSLSELDVQSLVFTSLGRGFNPAKKLFCFRNKRFNLKKVYQHLRPMESLFMSKPRTDFVEFELSHNFVNSVNNLTILNFRINRVSSGSTCSIKSIEIWGQPSQFVPKDVCENFLQIYNGLIEKKDNRDERRYSQMCDSPTLNCVSTNVGNKDHIPCDFIDPITQNILAMPMLLPSGHTVDITTIEKHNKREAKWGRLPSDPFTGKVFTEKSAPVPNVSLKVRLDKFLLQNSHIKPSSYAIGYCTSTPEVSKLASKPDVYKFPEEGNISKDQMKRKSSTLTEGNKSSEGNKKVKLDTCAASTEEKNGCLKNDLTMASSSSQFKHGTLSNTHSSRLNSSLALALSSTLSHLPSFNKKSNKLLETTKKLCTLCKKYDNKSMYRCKCTHLICRCCLVSLNAQPVKCPVDKTDILQNEVVKVHLL